MSWWEDLALNTILVLIRGLVKNPGKAADVKDTLLHLRDSINDLYPGM